MPTNIPHFSSNSMLAGRVHPVFGMILHTCTHACTHICMHAHMHAYTHMYACIQTWMHSHTHICTCTLHTSAHGDINMWIVMVIKPK